MTDALDRQRATTGYSLATATRETLHVWPMTPCAEGLVVVVRDGMPAGLSTSRAATIPMTDGNAPLLHDIWAALLTNWRRRRS